MDLPALPKGSRAACLVLRLRMAGRNDHIMTAHFAWTEGPREYCYFAVYGGNTFSVREVGLGMWQAMRSDQFGGLEHIGMFPYADDARRKCEVIGYGVMQ